MLIKDGTVRYCSFYVFLGSLYRANFWPIGFFKQCDVRDHGIHQSINSLKKFD